MDETRVCLTCIKIQITLRPASAHFRENDRIPPKNEGMSTTTQAVVSTPSSSFAKRRARTLIGWLTEQEGALWLAGREMGTPDPAHVEICKKARAAVAARQAGVDQNELFAPLPPEVEAYVQ